MAIQSQGKKKTSSVFKSLVSRKLQKAHYYRKDRLPGVLCLIYQWQSLGENVMIFIMQHSYVGTNIIRLKV